MICSNSITCTLVVDNVSITSLSIAVGVTPHGQCNATMHWCTRGGVWITIAVDQSKYVTNCSCVRITRNTSSCVACAMLRLSSGFLDTSKRRSAR